MPPTPKQTIEPSFIQDLACPVCGQDTLRLKSMERYPDYVTCTNCSSQFVAEEGGERVMYGEIPRTYPRTRKFALQEWAWPEAVARRAAEERSESGEPSTQPPAPSAADQAQAPPAEAPAAEPPSEAPGQPTPPADLEPTVGQPEATEEPKALGFEEEPPAPPTAEEPAAEPAQPTPPSAPEPAEQEPEEPELPSFEAEAPEAVTPDQPTTDDAALEADMEPPPWQPPEETEAEPPQAPEPASSQEDLDEEEDWLPPFGEAPEEEERADLPEDFEPAPEMPDWLAQEEPSAEAEADPSQPPVQEAGDADDDLAAALWDEQETEAQEDEAVRLDRDQAEESQFASDFMSELEAETPEEPREADLGAPAPERESKEYSQEELAAMYWTGEAHPETETTAEEPSAQHVTEPGLETPEAGEAPSESIPSREPIEPEPGVRHRVVLKTSQPNIPEDMCAHCTQTPTVATLPVRTTLYRGTGVGERQVATFQVPICADCRNRLNAKSDEQQTARLQAHLISVLVALVLVVGALAFRVVNFQDAIFVDLAVLVVLALMGYVVPVAILLLRASRYSQPADARYVATTMRIPGDTEGLETAYEWRSAEYASHFLQTNNETATGGVTKVKERQYEARDTQQPAE